MQQKRGYLLAPPLPHFRILPPLSLRSKQQLCQMKALYPTGE